MNSHFKILTQLALYHYNVTLETLTSSKRNRLVVELRMIISALLRKVDCKITLKEIGFLLSKDHATISHYLKTHARFFSDKTPNRSYQGLFATMANNFKIALNEQQNLKSELANLQKQKASLDEKINHIQFLLNYETAEQKLSLEDNPSRVEYIVRPDDFKG